MGTHGARGGAEVAGGASNLVGDVLEVAHLAAEGAVDAVAHGGTEGAAQALDRLGELSHLLRHLADALLLVRRALVLRLHELHEHGLELVDADGGEPRHVRIVFGSARKKPRARGWAERQDARFP